MPASPKRNLAFALNLAAIAAGMLGLAFASVPLYRLFCGATGFAGTPIRGTASTRVGTRMMTVRFNTDIAPGLPWDFRPEVPQVTVRLGENTLAYFIARNNTDHPITGRAIYNVVPQKVGGYFVKTECFCFKNQTLAPHQEARMPVTFFIDPALADDPGVNDVTTITLSYTFFPATSDK